MVHIIKSCVISLQAVQNYKSTNKILLIKTKSPKINKEYLFVFNTN